MGAFESYASIADLIADPSKVSVSQLKDYLQQLIEELPDEPDKKLVRDVIVLVKDHTNYFEAPASARFHLNEPYGLLRHSLGVTYRLLALMAVYGTTLYYRKVDVVLAGMLHDLGKASQVWLADWESEKATKIGTKLCSIDSTDYYVKEYLKTRPAEFKYKRNPERIVMSIPLGSLHFIATVLSDLWKPNPDVWAALAGHDGQYVDANKEFANSETRLGLTLHQADIYQSRTESGWVNGSSWSA
jgi:hypothetical protein